MCTDLLTRRRQRTGETSENVNEHMKDGERREEFEQGAARESSEWEHWTSMMNCRWLFGDSGQEVEER